MVQLTQPLPATAGETELSVPADDDAGETPSFPELVYAHFDWWRQTQKRALLPETKLHYDRVRAGFQAAHGDIVRAYWCSHIESAVVLTEKKSKYPWGSPQCGFHRESDWATQDWPDIAKELHRCDELAVKAKSVLTGVRQRICLNLVMASATHLMSVVDKRTKSTDPAASAKTLADEQRAITAIDKYYREAANGQAQIVYFAGMASVALLVALISTIWLAISWSIPVAALVAGSVGAVVSVTQRINAGHFELDYDVGRPYAFFLGGLRPLIGGAFAVVLSFAFRGGLLNLPVDSANKGDHRLALLVVAFLAGFSERWAQDTLAAAVPDMKKKDEPQPVVEQPCPEEAAVTPSTAGP
jgi:hypothetical protein